MAIPPLSDGLAIVKEGDMSLEALAYCVALLSGLLVMGVCFCICHHLDQRNRIWLNDDREQLNRIKDEWPGPKIGDE